MFTAWDDIRDEVLRRIGRRQINWEPRGEHVTDAAFNFVATEYHHPFLDTRASGGTITLTAGTDSAALPADWQNIIFVKLRAQTTDAFVANVRKEKIGAIAMKQNDSIGRPRFYTVFENDLLFDRDADATYWPDVRYYKQPIQPVYEPTPTVFPLELVWVEPTIIKATALGFKATFRPDLGAQQDAAFEAEVAKIPTALLVRDLIQQLSEQVQDATIGHQGSRA